MKITSFLKPKQENVGQKIKSKNIEKISEKESGLKELNLKKTDTNTKIYKTLKANGIEPTKEMIEDIKGHFEQLEGPLSQKIETLDLILKKGIEVTFKNLVSVHQTLESSIDYGEIFKKIKSMYPDQETIDHKTILEALELSEKSAELIAEAFDFELSFDANVLKVFESSKEEMPIKDQKVLETLISEGDKPKDFTEKDTETLLDAFERNVSDVLTEVKNEMLEGVEWLPEVNHFRKFLVEKTTEKMSEVKVEFDQFKNEVSLAVDKMLEEPRQQLTQESLEKVIQNFEKVIMKSDITLYTSMTEEKELIQMASLLEEAKTLVAKEEIPKAKKILVGIKERLDKIDFQPKESKVKAFMKADLKELFYGKKAVVETIEDQIKRPNKGPRESLEVLRNLGVNHEAEVIQTFDQKGHEKLPLENIKNILMSLMANNSAEENSTEMKSTLDHVTGQQLLSKLEVKSNLQQMTLNIPYMAENKIKSLDLFIQAKKEGEKIDWKNSTLYFVMDLNRYGKTGIKIQSVNKVVNMTVKNNNDRIKEETQGVFESFLDELSDEGFKKGFIQYFDFDTSEKNQGNITIPIEKSKENEPYNFEKGFDLKI